MNVIAEMIYQEVRQLPEALTQEVYDFVRFVEARHGIEIRREGASPASDWKTFFDRHTRTVEDACPMSRDEIYADRLR